MTEKVDRVTVTPEEAENVLRSFRGTISQVPPMYSAVKVDGKRLYELAREGKTVERKSREVTIYEIEMKGHEWQGPYLDISFRALCSKGTYIRTLCVDIGKALGLPATMVRLTRTMSAGIPASACLTLEEVERLMQEGSLQEHLIQIDHAVRHFAGAHRSGRQGCRGAAGPEALRQGRFPGSADFRLHSSVRQRRRFSRDL